MPLIFGRHRLWHWTTTVSDHLRSPSFRSWLMDTSLVNAFADACLEQILEFHLWLFNTNTPNRSYLSLFKTTTLLLKKRSILFSSFKSFSIIPCFLIQSILNKEQTLRFNSSNRLKHSNLFKVNYYHLFLLQVINNKKFKYLTWKISFFNLNQEILTNQMFISNYERFNCNNIRIHF